MPGLVEIVEAFKIPQVEADEIGLGIVRAIILNEQKTNIPKH